MLNCDEREEIRIILKEIQKLYSTALTNSIVGGSELCALVLDYIPNIRASYVRFVDLLNANERR